MMMFKTWGYIVRYPRFDGSDHDIYNTVSDDGPGIDLHV